ncbi:helix-turn-helix transcriptional regulator [Mycobacterium sp. Marseille-P9652]|uniref:helix-turn-helix transcriptional regulator n=1 Tax=Mycobacterium sp. Marseille-P9652 TaxID=2654950 RepID=UPI0012E88264|nr:LuxR family transcriptional regulator [Mycobacterium sp. Marseille-P9652]
MRPHWPLIGRDQEIREITRCITDDAELGVAIAGQPGVGKSRLAREIARSASEAGWTVRTVAATATSRLVPLGAFSQWADTAAGDPLTLARNVIGALTDGTGPDRLVVFVDDAHLLDELSALVVHHLVHSRSAGVILTIRAGEAAPAAVTALWKDGLLRRRDLGPLTRRETETLLTAAFDTAPDPPCADRLWRLTGGNVLFLRQLVEQEHRAGRMTVRDGAVRWHGVTEVSGTLAELLDAQIGAIPDEVRDVVDLVAVAEPVEWDFLRLMANQDAVEDAEQRDLIRISGGDVYVGHPLYAEARLTRCGSARLRRLRGQVATAMKEGGGPAQAVKRGLLWLESDLPQEPDVLMSAATAASSLLDFETAERLFAAAAATGVGAQARVPLAYSLFMMEKGELALEVLDGVEIDEATESAFINHVVMRASNLLWGMRSPERSWRLIEDALANAHGVPRHQLLVFRANQLSLAARPRDVLATMAQVDYSRLDGYGTTVGHAAESLAHGELGQLDQAMAKARDAAWALDLSEQGRFLQQPVTEFLTFALTAAGQIAKAVELAERHRRALRNEPAAVRAVASEILGMARLAAGDLGAALELLPENIGDDMTNNFNVVNSFHRFHLMRAQALARSGDADGAERAMKTARMYQHPAYIYVATIDMLTEAWLAAVRSRYSEARHLARRAADFARDHDQFAREVCCLQTAVQFDDTDAADRLAELATHVQGPRAAVAARYAAALSADNAGELDRASTDFEAMGDLLAAADAAGQAATSHRRAGRPGSAMTAATRAHRLADQCGGATSPAIEAASLTPAFSNREREIAVLVAQGLSNREIAEAVSLSVRTVESHIYRASAKAGVSGRSALAAMMRDADG